MAHELTACGGLLGSGIEPKLPALAGRFFTTEPPGKPFGRCFADLVSV